MTGGVVKENYQEKKHKLRPFALSVNTFTDNACPVQCTAMHIGETLSSVHFLFFFFYRSALRNRTRRLTEKHDAYSTQLIMCACSLSTNISFQIPSCCDVVWFRCCTVFHQLPTASSNQEKRVYYHPVCVHVARVCVFCQNFPVDCFLLETLLRSTSLCVNWSACVIAKLSNLT